MPLVGLVPLDSLKYTLQEYVMYNVISGQLHPENLYETLALW